jgi:hypothetical protein
MQIRAEAKELRKQYYGNGTKYMHHSCLRNVTQTELICLGGLLQE